MKKEEEKEWKKNKNKAVYCARYYSCYGRVQKLTALKFPCRAKQSFLGKQAVSKVNAVGTKECKDMES